MPFSNGRGKDRRQYVDSALERKAHELRASEATDAELFDLAVQLGARSARQTRQWLQQASGETIEPERFRRFLCYDIATALRFKKA